MVADLTVEGVVAPTPVVTRLRAFARRDDLTAGALCALILVAGVVHGFTVGEALAAGVLVVPLAWRSRWPLGVLAFVAAESLVYLALANDFPAFVPPLWVALYTVAAGGERRRSLAVAAAVVPFTFLVAVLFSPDDGSSLRQTLELCSQFGFALAVGEAVRSRRAMLEAVRARAEHAAREHELEAQRRVDEERMRIARDVHDVVAHSLATIATQAAVGVHVGRQDPEQALDVLRAVKAVSTDALHDLRHALGVVRADAPTRPTPALDQVPELIGRARGSGLSVTLRMEGSPGGLSPALQVAVYRIVQEGLTNVMRHAGGARAEVRIAIDGHDVEVDVTNDASGHPTPAADAGTGSGLIGMRERASALGGAFSAGEGSDGGFYVRAVLPREGQPA